MAKLPPLSGFTSLDGIAYVFDSAKISALYTVNRILPGPSVGPVALHVFGITPTPLPIGGTAATFLASLKIPHFADQFVTVTGNNGQMLLKAQAVSLLLAHYPGVTDPNTKCVAFLGTQLFQIHEDVPTIRALVDGVRQTVIPNFEIMPEVLASAGNMTIVDGLAAHPS